MTYEIGDKDGVKAYLEIECKQAEKVSDNERRAWAEKMLTEVRTGCWNIYLQAGYVQSNLSMKLGNDLLSARSLIEKIYPEFIKAPAPAYLAGKLYQCVYSEVSSSRPVCNS
jgi:hypothetical protein